MAAGVVGLVLSAAAFSGCGGSSDSAEPATTSTSTTTTTTTSTPVRPTAKPGTTTTTAPVGPSLFSATPRGAVEQLVSAWRAGDRAAAARVADATAVRNIFTQPAGGFELYGCDSGEFTTSTCNYRNRSTAGYAQITADKQAAGWIVTAVYMSTDG